MAATQLGSNRGSRGGRSGQVTPAQLGGYFVVVSNEFHSTTSRVASLLTSEPVILTQPADVVVGAGNTANFSVVAVNRANLPMSYQWYFNQTNLVGENSTLVIPNVGQEQLGGYSVVVTNDMGAVTSRVASLSLTYPPAIVVQPQSWTIVAGDSVTFTVEVTNNATLPIYYSWRKFSTVVTNRSSIAGPVLHALQRVPQRHHQ